MVDYTELVNDKVNAAENLGSSISAGKSSSDTSTQKILTAQFPAERASSYDNTDSGESVNNSYENGLLFTAYNYTSRTSPDLRSMRTQQQTKFKKLKKVTKVLNAINSVVGSNKSEDKTSKTPVANILMPRSKSDTDSTSHKFNDVSESIITRGNGSVLGVLSNLASTAVFGAIDSATQGVMADYGEQIYNTGRSMYAGAENRSKVYTWELTPRTPQDLMQIVKIYEIFNFLSYGVVGNSQFAKDIKKKIDDAYRKTILNPINKATDTSSSSSVMEAVTDFLSNVIVVSNPTVWFINQFGVSSEFDGMADIFGPAQIQSIRFDKASDGKFSGLSIAPNMPSTFVLEVTFREILTLNRATVYGEDVL